VSVQCLPLETSETIAERSCAGSGFRDLVSKPRTAS
jgi:hypothetical protein